MICFLQLIIFPPKYYRNKYILLSSTNQYKHSHFYNTNLNDPINTKVIKTFFSLFSKTQWSHREELHIDAYLRHTSRRRCLKKQRLISATEVVGVLVVVVVVIFLSTQKSRLPCSDSPSCWLSPTLKYSGLGQAKVWGKKEGSGNQQGVAHSFVTVRRLFDIFTPK